MSAHDRAELFERAPVPKALATMALPTIASQLVTLVYNIADTWFIGRTRNPYMVAASSLVLTVFLLATALSNLFGVGGGSLTVRLLGRRETDEAERVASYSLTMAAFCALAYSLLCLATMDPLLRLLGASDNTIGYARQYLLFVSVIGGVPTVLSVTMGSMLRNVGFSREAGLGLSMGGLLNIALDPLFMFVLLPDGYQVMGAGLATMLSNVVTLCYFVAVYRRVGAVSVLKLPRRVERIRRESARLGTQFLRARCFATPLMFLSFHMVHFMQAVGQGGVSFRLAAIRQLALNIPLLFLLNRLFGMSGVVWTQATADFLNVVASYIIYSRVIVTIRRAQEG